MLLLGAAVGAGILVRWLQHKQGAGSGNGDSNGLQIGNGDTNSFAQNSLPQSVKDAQDLVASGKADDANKQIAQDLTTTSNQDEKYELYLVQGVNYENQQQYDNAITAYKSAEAIKKTWTVYKALGRVSETKGDKAAALGYYKQALAALDPKDPQYKSEQAEVQQTIQALGG